MRPRMRALARLTAGIVILVMTVVPAVSQSGAPTSLIDRFTGTWQEDESKRQTGSLANLIFRRNASGGLEEIRGGEARPMVQQVIFDGKPHLSDVDTAIAWKQINETTFERALTESGRLVNTRRIRISGDGKTLTQETEQKTTDGRPVVTTIVYQRTTGDAAGLVGRWKPQSFKSSRPARVKYERGGANALKFASDFGLNYIVALDDKAVTVNGPATITGTMIAAKQADDRMIETTSSREGVITGRGKRVLSPDGKTMTVTGINVGPNASTEPSVTVYVKQ